MKKLITITALIATLMAGAIIGLGGGRARAEDASPTAIVGAWYVQAIGAPYEPHLFTFMSDGTMLTTNPTNVQEDVTADHGGTNDSVGMGVWKTVTIAGHRYAVGTFRQLNANADDHQPADDLEVSFKLSVDGDSFTGPAMAHLGPFSAPATLNGTRLQINQTDVDNL